MNLLPEDNYISKKKENANWTGFPKLVCFLVLLAFELRASSLQELAGS
jgi:hypothetical protein